MTTPFTIPSDLADWLRWLGVDITRLDYYAALEWEAEYLDWLAGEGLVLGALQARPTRHAVLPS